MIVRKRRSDYNEPILLSRVYSGDRSAIHERTRRKINAFAKGNKRIALILLAHEHGENQSPIELSVNRVLQANGWDGRSQVPIDDKYIVDFLLRDGITIVEADGQEFHKSRNIERDHWLVSAGFRILHLAGKTCIDFDLCQNIIGQFIEDKESLIWYR